MTSARDASDVARETAELLRRLLDMIERGDLDAGSARARALVRRLEGAAVALETLAAPHDP